MQDAISKPAKSRATGIAPRSSRGTWGTTEALTPEEEEQLSRDNAVAEALAEVEAGTGLFTPPRTRSSNKILFTDMPEECFVHHFTNNEVGAAAYSATVSARAGAILNQSIDTPVQRLIQATKFRAACEMITATVRDSGVVPEDVLVRILAAALANGHALYTIDAALQTLPDDFMVFVT